MKKCYIHARVKLCDFHIASRFSSYDLQAVFLSCSTSCLQVSRGRMEWTDLMTSPALPHQVITVAFCRIVFVAYNCTQFKNIIKFPVFKMHM